MSYKFSLSVAGPERRHVSDPVQFVSGPRHAPHWWPSSLVEPLAPRAVSMRSAARWRRSFPIYTYSELIKLSLLFVIKVILIFHSFLPSPLYSFFCYLLFCVFIPLSSFFFLFIFVLFLTMMLQLRPTYNHHQFLFLFSFVSFLLSLLLSVLLHHFVSTLSGSVSWPSTYFFFSFVLCYFLLSTFLFFVQLLIQSSEKSLSRNVRTRRVKWSGAPSNRWPPRSPDLTPWSIFVLWVCKRHRLSWIIATREYVAWQNRQRCRDRYQWNAGQYLARNWTSSWCV